MKKKNMIALVAAGVLFLGATAGAAIYMMDEPQNAETAKVSQSEQINWNDNNQAQAQPQAQPCNDDNIVGKVVGGVAGGVAGSQFGKGNGKTAATIGGTVGGGLLGEEYIPTHNATC